jgi:DNA repair photolyase
MPGINDAPEQVEPLLEAAAAAGATGIGGIALHLRGDVRQLFMDWLRSYRPELVALYEQLYERGAYAPADERRRLAAMLRPPGTPPPSRFRVRDRAEIEAQAGAPSQPPASEVQTTLF